MQLLAWQQPQLCTPSVLKEVGTGHLVEGEGEEGE